MTWFRVDDSLAMHPKVLAAGNRAMGTWLLAGCWSSYYLTDGFIPAHVLPVMGATKTDAARLVDVGLWDNAEGGYQFHDWDHYQPTAEEVRADRAAKHEAKVKAGRLGGVASGISRRRNGAQPKQSGSTAEATGEANAEQNEAPTRPDLIQTPSVSEARKRAKRKTPPPDDMIITPEMAAWGRANAPLVTDPRAETARFLDHARANGKTFIDWPAAWRTWMGNAQKYAERDGRAIAPAKPTEPSWMRG